MRELEAEVEEYLSLNTIREQFRLNAVREIGEPLTDSDWGLQD